MRKRVGVDVCVGKLELVGKIEGEIEVKMVEGVKVRSRLKEVGVRFEELRDEIVGLVGGLG